MRGLNTELKYKGATFYIQTQDMGIPTRYVESLIYKSGKLLTSRKTSYLPLLSSPDLNEKINQIIEDQHNAILKEISSGKFDRYLTSEKKNSP